MRRPTMSRGALIKLGLLGGVVAVAVVLQLVVGLPDRAELEEFLDGLGAWLVPAYIGLYVLVCLLPAGPTGVLTVVGGALLGFTTGLPTVLVGAVLGSAVAFAISRLLGRDAVHRVSGTRVRALDERVRRHGFATVLVARLVPLVPFSTANFAFGLTSVQPRAYLSATVIGILPGSAVYVAVGAYGTRPGSLPFLLAVAGLVLLGGIGFIRSRRARAANLGDSAGLA